MDYVLKGTVGLLAAISTTLATWVWQAESRIMSLETQITITERDILKLQAQDAVLQSLQMDLAVVKSQQQATSKQLDRIEALLVR